MIVYHWIEISLFFYNSSYAGHKERLAAAEARREANLLHQQAMAAYQYANQMEAGRFDRSI